MSSRAQNSLDLLRQSVKTLHETEQIGNHTLVTLQEQTPQIKASQEKISKSKDDLSFANRLLNKMKSWWRQ